MTSHSGAFPLAGLQQSKILHFLALWTPNQSVLHLTLWYTWDVPYPWATLPARQRGTKHPTAPTTALTSRAHPW